MHKHTQCQCLLCQMSVTRQQKHLENCTVKRNWSQHLDYHVKSIKMFAQKHTWQTLIKTHRTYQYNTLHTGFTVGDNCPAKLQPVGKLSCQKIFLEKALTGREFSPSNLENLAGLSKVCILLHFEVQFLTIFLHVPSDSPPVQHQVRTHPLAV